MLVLFKPWRKGSDLLGHGQTWEESFQEFVEICPEQFIKIMDNMQILHECCDSRDDHYAQRHNRQSQSSMDLPQSMLQSADIDDDCIDCDDEQGLILEHLEAISSSCSKKTSASQQVVLQCLHHLHLCGIYSSDNVALPDLLNDDCETTELHANDSALESVWQKAYEDR
jgi:hypothetical protein